MYREIRTMEEAEQFLGKVIKKNDNKLTFVVTEVELYKFYEKDGYIKINNENPFYLLNNYTCDGNPLGILEPDEAPKFELPVLNDDMKRAIKFLGISEVEAQIRMYVQNIGWKDTKEWRIDIQHYSLYYYTCFSNWCSRETNVYNDFAIYIDTKEHAKELYELLNKNNIKS